MSDKLYAHAMGKCRLENGKLYLTSFYSLEDLQLIWTRLTSDILAAKIPNYRPIAINNNNTGNWHREYPALWVPHYDATFSKMQDRLNYLCLAERKPYPANFWGYCTLDDLQSTYEFPERELKFGEYAGQEILYHVAWPLPDRLGCGGTAAPYANKGGRKHEMSILTEDRTNFEMVWTATSVSEFDDDDPYNTHFELVSEDFLIPKSGIPSKDVTKTWNQIPHDWLLPDTVVAEQNWSKEYKYSGVNLPTKYIVLLYKGTGYRTDKENAKLVMDGVTRFTFKFVNTDYSLSKFFNVKYPKTGCNYLELAYLENVNEKVIKHILEEYGRSL